MAKKEENKDKSTNAKTGKATKKPTKSGKVKEPVNLGDKADEPIVSGKVKEPVDTAKSAKNEPTRKKSTAKKAAEDSVVKSSSETKKPKTKSTSKKASEVKDSGEEVKKLPKPKKALPESGTADKPAAKETKISKKSKKSGTSTDKTTTKPAKFEDPVVDEELPDVAAPATKRTTTPDDDLQEDLKKTARVKKTEKKVNLPGSRSKAPQEKAEDTAAAKPTKTGAKKMPRRKPEPGISAEEKMKLPNTSPTEDLKKTAKKTGKDLADKLTPDEQTKRDLEEKAKDLIPDPEEVRDTAAKIAGKIAPGVAKAKDFVEKLIPDQEDIAKATEKAKDTVDKVTGDNKVEQKSSQEKPAEATLLTDFDVHLFREGKHYSLYNKLGSHIMNYMDTEGVYFAVWAPNAQSVSVTGDFNNWNRDSHPMKGRSDGSGIWEVFIPEAKKGTLYKYFIRSTNGYEAEKGDPYAFSWETPPNTASMVWDLENTWKDKSWLEKRKKDSQKPKPYSVYEIHLGSWKRVPEDGMRSLTYRELAEDLPNYLKEMEFTHVEFMPVMEHPFFGSWGYQITGYFAPSSRFGTPQDFMYLIDRLHQEGIGVILDWVPSHFPSDLHGLHYFDGTYLYEHADPRKGFHPDWQSYIFNYGRNEVRSFLISNALFWLDKFHVDGLRVDAVASMLYLDYSRKEGEWEPNEHGGNENLEAISFLKEFNEVVYKEFPDAVTIAEESTAWPMVSKPTYIGGLGFGMKWMMGWMHDTLKYFSEDPIHRRYHQNTITFSTTYAFTENFMLPLSHDEVVYGKQSILNKMPGDQWNKFANLRTLYSYMYAHPGTKLLFMGAEFGQLSEWNHDSSLEWHLTNDPLHRQIQETLKELNRIYKNEPAFYEKAFDYEGFEWVDINDEENSIVSFIRKGENVKENVLVVCNFTPVPRENYRIGVPEKGNWKEIFNSDDERFGGSNIKNVGNVESQPLGVHGKENSLSLIIPPMAVVYLKRS